MAHEFDADTLVADLRYAEELAALMTLYGDADAPHHLTRLLL